MQIWSLNLFTRQSHSKLGRFLFHTQPSGFPLQLETAGSNQSNKLNIFVVADESDTHRLDKSEFGLISAFIFSCACGVICLSSLEREREGGGGEQPNDIPPT